MSLQTYIQTIPTVILNEASYDQRDPEAADGKTSPKLDAIRRSPRLRKSPLGSGAFGRVEAWHTPVGECAVKNVFKEKYFQYEIRILSLLGNHQNLVEFYGCDHTTKQIFMEFIIGQPLDTLISKDGLSTEDTYTITKGIAKGLDYLHGYIENDFTRKLLCHRDIKPQNVLINDMKQAKIVDFGVSKVLEASNPDLAMSETFGASYGTSDYWPPEAFSERRRMTPHCDYWALGVVCYQMFTGGALPFSEINADNLWARIGSIKPRVLQREYGPEAKQLDKKQRQLIIRFFGLVGQDASHRAYRESDIADLLSEESL